jgi:hypothetical protein
VRLCGIDGPSNVVGIPLRGIATLFGTLQLSFGLMVELLVPSFRLSRLLPEFIGTADNIDLSGLSHDAMILDWSAAPRRDFWGDKGRAALAFFALLATAFAAVAANVPAASAAKSVLWDDWFLLLLGFFGVHGVLHLSLSRDSCDFSGMRACSAFAAVDNEDVAALTGQVHTAAVNPPALRR